MTDITAVRFQGDRPQEDIVDALLATDTAAIARARAELNQSSLSEQRRIYDIDFRVGLRKGQVVSVFDEAAGQLVRGKISEIHISGKYAQHPGDRDVELTAQITLLVPTNFYE